MGFARFELANESASRIRECQVSAIGRNRRCVHRIVGRIRGDAACTKRASGRGNPDRRHRRVPAATAMTQSPARMSAGQLPTQAIRLRLSLDSSSRRRTADSVLLGESRRL
jgi:hypothetical protein